MRILLTADTMGGVWTFALQLAAALSRRGEDVVLAAMGPRWTAEQEAEVRGIPGLDAHFRPYRLEWMDEPWEDLRSAAAWLLELSREVSPDVVHLNQYAFGILPFRHPVVLTAHSCVLSWWEAVHGEPAPPAWGRYARLVRAGLWSAGRVTAPTAAMAREIDRLHGPLRDVVVVPNGRDPDAVVHAAAKAPVILAAGRLWDEAKNVPALARVAPDLPWEVRVAGEEASPDGRTVPRGAVRHLGRLSREDLATEMARAAIFVHPARYEPFGLAPLEAGLAGCALVLSDLPSLREIWRDAALFVDPGREDDLAAALQVLCADADLRADLAARARARAGMFPSDRTAQAYRAIYRAMAPARAAERATARV